MTEVQELVARLRLRDEMSGPVRKVRAGVSNLAAELNSPRMRRGVSQIGTGIKNAAAIGIVGIALLTTQLVAGLNSLVKLEKQEAQTAAVIASTGGVAGITAVQVGKLAEKYESLNATIGDEVIRSAQNMLLTFTNVREKAFEPALAAVLDMNTAMGKGPEGLTTTAIAVGKALNNPTKGMTALQKAGVTFTAAQVKKIKSLQAEGKLYEAQTIILAELDKEFGGSFLGQGGTTAGKVGKFTDSIEDLQRALATALLPTVGIVADKLTEFLANPAVMKGAEDLGKSIAGLFSDKNLAAGGRIFRDVFTAAKSAAPAIASAARVTGEIVGTAVRLFRSLPPELQGMAVTALAVNKLTGGLVTNIAGGLIEAVIKRLVSAVVNVNGAVVNVNGVAGGLGGGVPGVVGGGKGALGTAVGLASKVFIVGMAAGAAQVIHDALQDVQLFPDGPPVTFKPGMSPLEMQWPYGPKNTPTLFADILGGNGLLGGTPTPVDVVKMPPRPEGLNPDEKAAREATRQAIRTAQIGITGSTDRVVRNTATQITAIQQVRAAQEKARGTTDAGLRNNAAIVRSAIANKKTNVTVNVSQNVSVSARNVVKQTARYRAVMD